MTSPVYQPGEHVRVTIDARIDSINLSATAITIRHGDRYIALNTTEPGVQVARVAPADGTPQLGEIWADALGGEWFAARRRGESRVYLHAFDGRVEPWEHVHTHVHLGPIRRVRAAAQAEPQHETAVL